MNALYLLKHAPEYGVPGSHDKRVRIARETARALLKLSRDRTNRSDLRQSLVNAEADDKAFTGPTYTGAGTCVLLADTRDRLVAELGQTPEQYRMAGGA